MRRAFSLSGVVVISCLTSGCQTQPHGRYQDAAGNYIDFRYAGTAFTNLGAGGGEVQITYERDGPRVTLHEVDGNPTLQLQNDGQLCCGPAGPLVLSAQR